MKRRESWHTSNARVKTSSSDPLRIDRVILPGMGYIGMTICPGKHYGAMDGHIWERDLGQDIDIIIKEGGKGILTLMTKDELERMKVSNLGDEVIKHELTWWHFPVEDGGVIGSNLFNKWDMLRKELIDFVIRGNNLVVHCRGGLGRTGTFASVLLMDILNIGAKEAISKIRSVRKGAIQAPVQLKFIHEYRRHFPLPVIYSENGSNA